MSLSKWPLELSGTGPSPESEIRRAVILGPEGAAEHSPGRKPWGRMPAKPSFKAPERGRQTAPKCETLSPLPGLTVLVSLVLVPGLTPWAIFLRPLWGSRGRFPDARLLTDH